MREMLRKSCISVVFFFFALCSLSYFYVSGFSFLFGDPLLNLETVSRTKMLGKTVVEDILIVGKCTSVGIVQYFSCGH